MSYRLHNLHSKNRSFFSLRLKIFFLFFRTLFFPLTDCYFSTPGHVVNSNLRFEIKTHGAVMLHGNEETVLTRFFRFLTFPVSGDALT